MKYKLTWSISHGSTWGTVEGNNLRRLVADCRAIIWGYGQGHGSGRISGPYVLGKRDLELEPISV